MAFRKNDKPDKPEESSEPKERAPVTPATRKRLQKCFEHACKQTSQQNYDYANELLGQCVAGDPTNMVYVRSFMENLQKKYANNRKGAAMAQFKEMGARGSIKKKLNDSEWDEAIKLGLKILAVNPWDIPTLRAMATASKNITHLGDVELYFLKCALEANPKDPDTNRQCARAMTDRLQYDQAIACWHRVEQALPTDEEAPHAISDLHVIKTMSILEATKQSMNKSASAESGGSGGRGHAETSPEDALKERISANAKDMQAYYDLAQIYISDNRFDEAATVFEQAFEANGGDDETREKWQDVEIRHLRHATVQAKAKRRESDEAEALYRRAYKLMIDKEIDVGKFRVERYPSVLRYKYELGVRLQAGKQFNEAIKQFQAARNDPRVKGLCLLGLAQCFQAIRQPRLAMDHFERAIAEIPDRDADNKKEALYQAGRMALEEVKDFAAADRYLSGLAGIDFTYKDVATLLDKIAKLRDNGGDSPEAAS